MWTKVYEGYLHHEIGRWCHVTLHPPDVECPVCLKPFDECRKWRPKVVKTVDTGPGKLDASTIEAIKTNETILEKAERIVMGDREQMYGHPKDNHKCTAALWNAYLDRRASTLPTPDAPISGDLSPEDVCILNILQKVSRCANKITKDSLADISGWARCIERIMDSNYTADEDDDRTGRHPFDPRTKEDDICQRCHQTEDFHLHHITGKIA